MKRIIITLILITLYSCVGNNVYFDLEKNGIITCDDELISKVIIEEIDGDFDFYSFKLKEHRKGIGVKFFNVYSINKAFEIRDNLGKIVKPYEYRLKASSKYKVRHMSKGDAAESYVIITTDENGKIIEADILDCN